MEKRCGMRPAKKFDLIAWNSVGSILAAALANEIRSDRLPKLFQGHGKKELTSFTYESWMSRTASPAQFFNRG